MTLHYLNSSFAPIATDSGIINSINTRINKAFAKPGTFVRPVLLEQFNAIKNHQRRLDRTLRELLVTLPADLQSDNMRELLNKVTDTYDHEAQNLYGTEIAGVLASALETVNMTAADFTEQLSQLKSIKPIDVSQFVDDNDLQARTQQGLCLALEKAAQHDTQQKEALNTAMRIIESKTLWDEWSPLLEGIIRMDPRNPIVSTIRAAVIGATTILSIAMETVNYGHLVTARQKLQDQIDTYYKQIKEYKARADTLSLDNGLLMNFQTVAGLKTEYEAHAGKIADTLSMFIDIHDSQAETDITERARFFVLHSEVLSRYLKDLLQGLK